MIQGFFWHFWECDAESYALCMSWHFESIVWHKRMLSHHQRIRFSSHFCVIKNSDNFF